MNPTEEQLDTIVTQLTQEQLDDLVRSDKVRTDGYFGDEFHIAGSIGGSFKEPDEKLVDTKLDVSCLDYKPTASMMRFFLMRHIRSMAA